MSVNSTSQTCHMLMDHNNIFGEKEEEKTIKLVLPSLYLFCAQ